MLKQEYVERMKKILGEDGFEEYKKAFENPPVRAFRLNTEKMGATESFVTGKLDFWEGAYTFECDKIGSHPYHHAGAIYVQEPSAMLPVASVKIGEDFRILDMCASPGGKSTQALSKIGSEGFVVSNEIVVSRCKVLSGNVERLGFKNTVVTSADTKVLADIFEGFFDLVICDAPCSGEGMFRKDEGAISEWSVDNVLMCAARQKEILSNAARCVKRGGKIIYSTCTFSPEENEENVKWFLDTFPCFSLCEPEDCVLKNSVSAISMPNARRVYPHLCVGEGQFFAVFEKVEGDINDSFNSKTALSSLDKAEEKIIKEFFERNLEKVPEGKLCKFKENIVLVPENLPVPEKITYSCGVTLGAVEKGVFRPHHQFFSALGELFKIKLDFTPDSPELQKYLHGDTFNTSSPDGFGAVTVDGMSVGGVKITGGIAKNHYPKGLRNN